MKALKCQSFVTSSNLVLFGLFNERNEMNPIQKQNMANRKKNSFLLIVFVFIIVNNGFVFKILFEFGTETGKGSALFMWRQSLIEGQSSQDQGHR